jgi:transcriptional regulator
MPQPWSFDASTTFVKRMLGQIVGFRIEIEKIEGNWKLNQNHPVERRRKVITALRNQGDEDSQSIAALMHETLPAEDGLRNENIDPARSPKEKGLRTNLEQA